MATTQTKTQKDDWCQLITSIFHIQGRTMNLYYLMLSETCYIKVTKFQAEAAAEKLNLRIINVARDNMQLLSEIQNNNF